MKEKSCGCIIFKKENEKIKFLVIKQVLGHYGFPKGHVEKNETEKETALREVKEETGLDISFLGDYKKVITYSPRANTIKDVIYFLGTVKGGTLKPQEEEVSLIKWFDFEVVIIYALNLAYHRVTEVYGVALSKYGFFYKVGI